MKREREREREKKKKKKKKEGKKALGESFQSSDSAADNGEKKKIRSV